VLAVTSRPTLLAVQLLIPLKKNKAADPDANGE
jgi:hypothetical protein